MPTCRFSPVYKFVMIHVSKGRTNNSSRLDQNSIVTLNAIIGTYSAHSFIDSINKATKNKIYAGVIYLMSRPT